MPLWSLHVDLGAWGHTLVCRWGGQEVGLLQVLPCAYLAPGSLGSMLVQLGAGVDARFACATQLQPRKGWRNHNWSANT